MLLASHLCNYYYSDCSERKNKVLVLSLTFVLYFVLIVNFLQIGIILIMCTLNINNIHYYLLWVNMSH